LDVNKVSRPLSIDDIVRIKALLPESIHFDYVDENNLQVSVDNSSNAVVMKDKDDMFKLPLGNPSTVLYFEFVDGELRPKLNRRKG
jgi:hypothetical protein